MGRKDEMWTERDGSYLETIRPEGYDILINGENHYLNFGFDVGVSGYGFRDNGGTMQWKNEGGSWQDIGTGGGGGSPGGDPTNLQFNDSGSFGGADINYTEPDALTRMLMPETPTGTGDDGKTFVLSGTAAGPEDNSDSINLLAINNDSAESVDSISFGAEIITSDPLLVVTIFSINSDHGDQVVTGITYDSEPFTFAVAQQEGDMRVEKWYLTPNTPSSGTILASFTGTVAQAAIYFLYYSGVDQTTPIEAVASDSGSGDTSPQSIDITTLTPYAHVEDGLITTILANLTGDNKQDTEANLIPISPELPIAQSVVSNRTPGASPGSFTDNWVWQPNEANDIEINDGGIGYAVNDRLRIQNGFEGPLIQVDSVDGDGVILTFSVVTPGGACFTDTNIATNGGTGSGATFDIDSLTADPLADWAQVAVAIKPVGGTLPGEGGAVLELLGGLSGNELSGYPRFTSHGGAQDILLELDYFEDEDGTTKGVRFNSDLISEGNIYDVAWPDKGGTVAMLSDIGGVSSLNSFTGNIIITGDLSVNVDSESNDIILSLVNDDSTPGDSMYYGTDSGGTKGWFALPSGGDGFWSADGDNIYNNNSGTVGIGGGTHPGNATLEVKDILSVGGVSETFSTIEDQGTGYTGGDVLTVDGGNGDATVNVGTVDGGGAITSFTVITEGTGYEDGNTYNLIGGTGSDAAITVGEDYKPIQTWYNEDGDPIFHIINHGLSPVSVILSPLLGKFMALSTNGGTRVRILKSDAGPVDIITGVDLDISLISSAEIRTQMFPDQDGIIYALPDPNVDSIAGWDDTDNLPVNISIGSGLSYDHGTHTLSATGVTNTPVRNEIVSGSGTTFTLAHVPAGDVALYGAGVRLYPSPYPSPDWSISGDTITFAASWDADSILADYEY